jgi:hypothetical protein
MLKEFQQLKRQNFHQTAQSVSVLHGRIKIFQRTSSFDHPDRQRALHCTCGRSSRRLREPEAECVRSAAQQQHATHETRGHSGILRVLFRPSTSPAKKKVHRLGLETTRWSITTVPHAHTTINASFQLGRCGEIIDGRVTGGKAHTVISHFGCRHASEERRQFFFLFDKNECVELPTKKAAMQRRYNELNCIFRSLLRGQVESFVYCGVCGYSYYTTRMGLTALINQRAFKNQTTVTTNELRVSNMAKFAAL